MKKSGIFLLFIGALFLFQTAAAQVAFPVSSFNQSQKYVNIANHVNIPQDLIYATDTATVKFNAVLHKNGPVSASNIRLAYTNSRYGVDAEIPANYDKVITQAGILYNGSWYAATFRGSGSSDTLSKNHGRDITDPIAGLVLPANAQFYTLTKTVAANQPSAQITISGITRATTGVVTYTGIDPTEGDIRRFSSVGGMIQVNYATNGSVPYTVKNLNTVAKTFELWNSAGSAAINTSGYTAYTSGGVADRQYTHYGTTTGSTMTQDGVISGNNPNVDITTIARGAKVLQTIDPSKITAGVLASGTATILKDPSNLGQGYGAGLLITAFYGVAGSDALGALYPGKGLGGFGSPSGGALGSVTVNSGSSKFDANNLPSFYVGGTGAVNTGWGTATGMWGPIAVIGKPARPVKTCLIVGDSYNAGGSVFPDGTGSIDEYLLMQQGCTVQRMAVSGSSSFGWNTHNTQQIALLQWLKSYGVSYKYIANLMGVNDFANNHGKSSMESTIPAMNATLKGIFPAAKIIVKEVEPGTTSTDSWVTLANQSPKVISGSTAIYGANGEVVQYNAGLRASNITPVPYDYLIRSAEIVRDAISPHLFNADLFKNTINGTISAVTQANPASVTSTGHGLTTGYFIEVTSGGTMTQLTGNRYKVTVSDANTFTLQTTTGSAVDSTTYTAFSGTGSWTRVAGATRDSTHRSGTASQAVLNAGYGWTLH